MKIQKNNQSNSLLYSGKNIINGNRQKNNKSPLLPNTQIAAYKVDADIKSDTIKDKLFRKRVQLLNDYKGNKENIQAAVSTAMSVGVSIDHDPCADQPLISDTDISMLESFFKDPQSSKADIGEALKKSGLDDKSLKAISDYLNSTDKPIIDVTNNGEKTDDEIMYVRSFFFGKPVLYRYDKSLDNKNSSEKNNKKYSINGIDITALENFQEKSATESNIIGLVNDTFYTLAKNLPNLKTAQANGKPGFGAAVADMCNQMSNIAKGINDYNKNYNDKSFFDNVINALETAKKSLYDDTDAQNNQGKFSAESKTKLIDYMINLFKQGKDGKVLVLQDNDDPNSKNYWDDMSNILASEFGVDNGRSLTDVSNEEVDDITWKYQQYKKKFMSDISKHYKILTNVFQYKGDEPDYGRWFKDIDLSTDTESLDQTYTRRGAKNYIKKS